MNDNILTYIPQRPPFIMIDELADVTEKSARTTFTIQDDNIFVTDGYFSESGMIENMAQTAGASTGYKSHIAGKPTPIGFFAALKNVNIISLPKAGDTITTEIVFQQTLLNFHLVTGRVLLDGNEIANGEFKIFESPETPPAKS
jgi:3-hydroxyacyl-[acyl-carrier-protein] dehydratase